MTRTQARKGFFISIAASVALWFLREPLADFADRTVEALTLKAYDANHYGRFFRAIIEDRWALVAAALVAVWFAYHYASAPPGGGDKGATK